MRKRKNFILLCLTLGLIYLIWLPKEQQMTVFLTGYSYWDNTPPGSAIIGRPVIHEVADGVGTYVDPVTLAVGWRIYFGRHFEDIKPGTRFYIPRLRKYAIVEDLCGDGPKPQNGPCHIGWKGNIWLDIYVDGSTTDPETANRCMEQLTGIQLVIRNPRLGYRVAPGRIVEANCEIF
jgi:hypothetical protein